MTPIRKAIFPVAGLGTRFLPATKASPKEMLTVVDKPLIQYAVEEAIDAGIKELIFVTSGAKRAIEDHFDTNYELESKLAEKNKQNELDQLRNMLPKDVNCVYIRQHQALGLGHAVLCARHLVGHEPFAVLLADDLIAGEGKSCLKQMVQQFHEKNAAVVAVQTVKPSETASYGIVSIDGHHQINAMVEKPTPEEAPSNLAAVGRYIFTSEIFDNLSQVTPGSGGEIQLTDAISAYLNTHSVMAYPFKGKRYDCGDKLGYLLANFDYALAHPTFGQACREYLKGTIS